MTEQLVFQQKVTDPFAPFALTDCLIQYAGDHNQTMLHFWQMEERVILGMKDTRLPHLKDAVTSLEKHGYEPIVRSAGGLGVVSDSGVLNVSLILPNPSEAKIAIDDAYTQMWQWLQRAFATAEQPIEAYEIPDSYCPGTFDLSIHGKKIAGIAQRRIKKGIAVMLYLSVNGNQLARGAAMRAFYQAGLQADFGSNGYPPVDPNVMANLADFLPEYDSIEAVKARLLATMPSQKIATDWSDFLKTKGLLAEFEHQRTRMLARNQILEEL